MTQSTTECPSSCRFNGCSLIYDLLLVRAFYTLLELKHIYKSEEPAISRYRFSMGIWIMHGPEVCTFYRHPLEKIKAINVGKARVSPLGAGRAHSVHSRMRDKHPPRRKILQVFELIYIQSC